MIKTEERLRILRDAKPDSWIAFSADESRVVAYGDTYGDVVERAGEAGETEPIVIKTPDNWNPRVL